ncbi:hypothetical protein BEN49_14630 [Hymenobacter coccineus]|uniref:Uncharacterized protein n=1 Tax=Hymenobacter coccineus TaxID=1908235 RepID=A0A1G1STY1_9BACT|nr:hypothetical protein BEN49_14630 [Hymenobacter coccineus]
MLLLAAAAQLACSRAREHEDSPAARTLVPPARTAAAPAVNVAAVVGRSIDEVRRQLGPARALPTGFQDPVRQAGTDSTLAFQPRGLVVVASYDARTRQVLDLLVLGNDEDALMRRAGLMAGAPTYLVLPVFALNRSTQLVGLRIVPRG